ncbi:MAG: hypothetical protein K5629_06850 [Eubacteriales bacterium]|nr:hypothetical protein [Eubacteriales bacterium]
MKDSYFDDALSDFDGTYRKKKITNLCISAIIVLLGVSSFIYGLHLEPALTIFRFMTVDGTLFTTIGSLIYIVANLIEIWKKTEVTNIVVYYIRLSSAVAETVIFIVVMFSQLPFFPEHLPVVDRYDSFVMHVLVPILGVSSFLVNDSPIGNLSAFNRFHGTWFITCYACTIFTMIGTGSLEHDLIPYFFLDVANNPWYITVIAFVFIYGSAYLMAWALSEWNRKLSWLWFKDVFRRSNKKGGNE